MIASQSYSRHRLVTFLSMCCAFVLLTTPALGNKHPELQLRTKKTKKAKKCKRLTKAKKTKSCKRENIFNGLPETLVSPTATPDLVRCLTALQLSGFNLSDFDNYSKWFDESSFMLITDTGVFTGIEGITEYVKSALPEKGTTEYVFKETIPYPNIPQGMLPIIANGNECIILLSDKVSFATYQLSSPVDTIVGTRLNFTILDDGPSPSKLHMNQGAIYFPKGFLGFLFSEAHGSSIARKICKTMQESCSSTFRKNCYTKSKLNKCISDMLSLPKQDEGGRLDGNSFGCRVIHSLFAESNKKHCQHISIDPAYDSNCNIKCQKSKEISNEDVFHPTELSFLAKYSLDVGLGENQWELTK